MKRYKKFLSVPVLLILLPFLMYDCSNHFKGTKGYTDISIILRLPDYYNHKFSGARAISASYGGGAQTAPRAVDPSASTVDVTVSAPDMYTITQTFSFTDTGIFGSGVGEVVCGVTDIPVEVSRQFNAC